MNRTPVLFLNVIVIATCGLVYELLAGTLASYVLGDSVTQFSLIIGIYLFSMGAGAWLSRFVGRELARVFVDVELAVAVLGGLSAPLLFLTFAHLGYFQVILYTMVFLIGALVGLEIPLLMRILKDHLDFKELVARVLALDYVGALVASLLFPIFLVPKLGLVRTSLVFGMLNAAVGLWATWLMQPLIRRASVSRLRAQGCVVIALLLVAFVKADSLTSLAEDAMFADDIVYTKTTHYQRIVVTRNRAGFQLFLNGNLQFSSADEYRYHEALVHPAMALAAEGGRAVGRVLILGGGDGLALREVLKYPSVGHVTLVDLDPDMTELSRRFPPLAELNRRALEDPRLSVVNEDAMLWLEREGPPFDAAVVDFPDPNTFALGKLYTTRFYRLLQRRLTPEAAVSVQSTSPLFARTSYWCVVRTMEAAGLSVRPYHTSVPSFGVWGFALARRAPFDPPAAAPADARFLNPEAMRAMFVLPADLGPVPVEINRLDNQALVRYYESEWRRYE
ncbi:MAG TPA: polyamine aminopropyltransferase [Pyrinomonadaceae bacterium]|nr:polyamine aminopropyltransferase [Pyrinomonadaceae bacterium]